MSDQERAEKTEQIMHKYIALSDNDKSYIAGVMEGMTIKAQMDKRTENMVGNRKD